MNNLTIIAQINKAIDDYINDSPVLLHSKDNLIIFVDLQTYTKLKEELDKEGVMYPSAKDVVRIKGIIIQTLCTLDTAVITITAYPKTYKVL